MTDHVCSCGGNCGCAEEQQAVGRKMYLTRDEYISRLEQYLVDLKAEIHSVETVGWLRSAPRQSCSVPVGPQMLSASNILPIAMQDNPGVSACEGQCLQNWPPVLTEKSPKADDGVDASKLGTLTREDGSIQVTYNEMPLYYYSGDLNPGDTNGQNVGGVWFVIAP